MVAVESTMLPLGTEAPDFELPDTGDHMVSLHSCTEAEAYCVMFLCNHCPFVKNIAPVLKDMVEEFKTENVAFYGINSNDVTKYPEDAPEKMADEGYTFPYLFDEDQEVAKAYRAACTPDFFVFDKNKKLTYRGRFDASRPGNGVEPSGVDLRRALEATLEGNAGKISEQHPSIGCNIKWKSGNSPDYF